jgi:hypothetical protein
MRVRTGEPHSSKSNNSNEYRIYAHVAARDLTAEIFKTEKSEEPKTFFFSIGLQRYLKCG